MMNDFSPFDLRAWTENGLTLQIRQKRSTTRKRTAKNSTRLYSLGAAAAFATAMALAPQTVVTNLSLSSMNWPSKVETSAYTLVNDEGISPTHWPTLVSALKLAPRIPDDDYSSDPDPIF